MLTLLKLNEEMLSGIYCFINLQTYSLESEQEHLVTEIL